MKPSFAIVGCGKVGTALGKFLAGAGYRIAGLAGKNILSVKKAAQIIGTGKFGLVSREITKDADIVFITTPDNIISDTCDIISQNNGFRENAVVLHCSGALPSTILSSAKKCKTFTGSMHPLQSFTAGESDINPFENIIISVEGENRAVNTAKKIAADLGAKCFTIGTEAKTAYHAAAVVASNYLVTLLDLAFGLIEKAGISGRDRFKVLKPLIEGTLSNIENVGISEALTGPIARGDVETVQRHLNEIALKTPELMSLYKALGYHTVDIAVKRGSIAKTTADSLRDILRFY